MRKFVVPLLFFVGLLSAVFIVDAAPASGTPKKTVEAEQFTPDEYGVYRIDHVVYYSSAGKNPSSLSAHGFYDITEDITELLIRDEVNGIPVVGVSGQDPYGGDNPSAPIKRPDLSRVKKVVIGKNVSYISAYAFGEMSALKTVEIKGGLRVLGQRAFFKCKNLKEIDLSNGVQYIKDFAFYGCKKLKTAILPDNLREIGNKAFAHTGLTEITIPKRCRTIGSYAFAYCPKLKSLTLRGNSTYCLLAERAFCGNSKLETVKIGKNTALILSNNVFNNCTALKTLTLPAKTLQIFVHALSGVPLQKIRLRMSNPASLRAVGTKKNVSFVNVLLKDCTAVVVNSEMKQALKDYGWHGKILINEKLA